MICFFMKNIIEFRVVVESIMKELTIIAFVSAGKVGTLSRFFDLCNRRNRQVKMYELFPHSSEEVTG